MKLKNIKKDSKSSNMIGLFSEVGPETKELFYKLKKENNNIGSKRLVCEKLDGKFFQL